MGSAQPTTKKAEKAHMITVKEVCEGEEQKPVTKRIDSGQYKNAQPCLNLISEHRVSNAQHPLLFSSSHGSSQRAMASPITQIAPNTVPTAAIVMCTPDYEVNAVCRDRFVNCVSCRKMVGWKCRFTPFTDSMLDQVL